MGAFVGGYFVLGHLTYLRAIATIREVTGLDFYRANAVYKAALSRDWSKISTNELRVPVPPDPRLFLQKGSQAEFKRQLIAMIVMERSRRKDTLMKHLMSLLLFLTLGAGVPAAELPKPLVTGLKNPESAAVGPDGRNGNSRF